MKFSYTSRSFVLLLSLCAAVPLIFIPAFDWLAVSKHGSAVFLLLNFLFVFPALAAFVGLLVCPFGLLFKRVRRATALSALCLVAYLIAFVFAAPIGERVRMNAFFKLAERSKPLIGAIQAFDQKNGHAPESLQALVPEFIASVPTTGIAAYPSYEYVSSATNWDGNPWVLRVETPLGILNWDQFMYFPLTNYPARGYGGWLERIGDWAYVHE